MAGQRVAFSPPLSKPQSKGLNSDDMISPGEHVPDTETADDKTHNKDTQKQDIQFPKDQALAPAPFDGLTEVSDVGDLPIIGDNNLKPFDAYKKPVAASSSKPLIALGITGIGLSHQLTEGVFSKLHSRASIILSPYAEHIDSLQKTARSYGNEVWLSLPLENHKFPFEDPGSRGILVNAGLKFNKDNLKYILGSTTGYAGLVSYTDQAFLDSPTMLSGILSQAFSRGLGFVELNSTNTAISRKTAVNNRAPYVKATLKKSDDTIKDIFTELKRQATRNGKSVGVIEISPAMLERFQAEIMRAQNEDYEIVPLSVVAEKF
jgi:hypothetical protein